jgi:hypothetical protein
MLATIACASVWLVRPVHVGVFAGSLVGGMRLTVSGYLLMTLQVHCSLHAPPPLVNQTRFYTKSHSSIESDMEGWVNRLDESMNAAPLVRWGSGRVLLLPCCRAVLCVQCGLPLSASVCGSRHIYIHISRPCVR